MKYCKMQGSPSLTFDARPQWEQPLFYTFFTLLPRKTPPNSVPSLKTRFFHRKLKVLKLQAAASAAEARA